MNIGKRIRERRKIKGITQVELAAHLGTSQAVITNYERGLRRPSVDKIPAIAEALDVSVEELYGINDVKPQQRTAPNKRTKQMQEVFDRLRPTDQRALLRQAKGLVNSKMAF